MPTTSTASRPSAATAGIDGADPSIAALTGRIEVRFADQTLVTQALAGDPCELVFGYALPWGESFTFTVHAVYLPRPRIEISGPQGLQVTFDWQAARDAGARADVHRHARQRRRELLGRKLAVHAGPPPQRATIGHSDVARPVTDKRTK